MRYNNEQLCRRFEKIKSDRAVIESHWQDLAKFFLPERTATLIQSVPGQKFDSTVYDSTGFHALQVAAAGLHGYLTNPTDRWFSLGVPGQDSGEAQEWLHYVEEDIFDTLNRSTFSEQVHEAYLDLFCFGTTAFYEQEIPGGEVSFHTRPMSEIFIVEGEDGQVDTVFRSFEMTARQAYQRWGKECGDSAMRHMTANKPDETVEYLHVVLPREEREYGKKDKYNMPIASVWLDYKTKKVVSEGGYEDMPFFTPRYSKTSGNVYGYSSCMVGLSDMKMLNAMVKTSIKAAQKLVDPPVILPNDGFMLPFKTTPGAVNFKNVGLNESFEVLQIPHQLPVGLEMEERRRQMIQGIMFTDLFLMLAQLKDKQMTAREVTERVNERMIVLSPVLGRIMREMLKPVIMRTFNIRYRNGRIPPPPAEIEGLESTIEFISPLAMAQKMAKSNQINELMGTLLSMAQGLPGLVKLIDEIKVGRELAKVYNQSNLLRSDDELQEIAQKEAEMMQMQQGLEMAKQGADVAKGLAEVEKMTNESR